MILIAPDKFKGTFSALEICEIAGERLRRAGYVGEICMRPLSDGGEGAAEVLMPGGRRIATGVYESADGLRRLLVSSEIVGFDAFASTGIPLMHRSSYALGKAAVRGIPTDIAVGGTATCDGGAGFLQALGVRFLDSDGNEISEPLSPVTLRRIAEVDTTPLAGYDLRGIVDVQAALTDGSLTALDFTPQKVLPGESTVGLEEALRHLKRVLGGHSVWDGAGGGIGYALASVCGARCVAGADAAVNALDVDWDKVSLIITGEGRVDRQTVRGGKLVDRLCREGESRGIPVLVLYGVAEPDMPYPLMMQINSPWEDIVKKSHHKFLHI